VARPERLELPTKRSSLGLYIQTYRELVLQTGFFTARYENAMYFKAGKRFEEAQSKVKCPAL
jgi:hypothetical protein